MADEDYVAARLSFQARLPYPASWQSQQCIEKYLKCMLLLRRVPAKDLYHDLRKALDLAVTSSVIDTALTPATQEFIEELAEVGEFRYFEISIVASNRDVTRLDRAVWELRRFCTIKPIRLELTQGKAAPRYELPGGLLESILTDKTNRAYQALTWCNGFFGKSTRRTIRMHGWQIMRNAPLYMHPEILDDVLKYVFLPSRLVKAWRNHITPGIVVPPDN